MNVRRPKAVYLEGCASLPRDLAAAAMSAGGPTPQQERAIGRCLRHLLAQIRQLRAEHVAQHGPIDEDD